MEEKIIKTVDEDGTICRISPATTLPEGWKWFCYDDGSGSIKSPEGKSYFSYDLSPYANIGGIEYKRNKDAGWTVFYGSLAEFKVNAEKELAKELGLENPDNISRTEITRKKILKAWQAHQFADFCSHPNLKALGICSGYVGADEECDFEEVVFAVPEKWLYDTCIRQFEDLKMPSDVQYFLDSVYTSSDALIIFVLAMQENQIVMLNFN